MITIILISLFRLFRDMITLSKLYGDYEITEAEKREYKKIIKK